MSSAWNRRLKKENITTLEEYLRFIYKITTWHIWGTTYNYELNQAVQKELSRSICELFDIKGCTIEQFHELTEELFFEPGAKELFREYLDIIGDYSDDDPNDSFIQEAILLDSIDFDELFNSKLKNL